MLGKFFFFFLPLYLHGRILLHTQLTHDRPVLINVASFRLIIGFIMSFKAVDWVQDMGFFKSFGIYSIALGIACLGLPFVYFYGKRIRMWTAGRLEPPLPTGKKFDEEGAGIAL